MKKPLFIYFISMFILSPELHAVVRGDSLIVHPFGKVHVYNKTDTPENVIILISGDGGWKFGVVEFARTFSEMNNLVIGIDILRYRRELKQRTEGCYSISADFVQLATIIEKKFNLSEYKPPVIMGYSSGATLVYVILAQARPGTFMGGISLGFCIDVELPKMFCQTHGVFEKTDIPGKRYLLLPDAKLGNPWIVLQGTLDRVCSYQDVADFVKKTTNAELISLPKCGHGFAKWNDFMPQWKDAFKRITEKYKADTPAEGINYEIKKLPVVVTKSLVQNKSAPLALLISGDGGWYSFEQAIADNLARVGIPTIGLDSKKYLWQRKTPEKTASDVTNIFNFYSKEFGKQRYLVIGYSLGAEIIPFILTRLSGELISKVTSAVLLSPQTTTDFEIHISNMLGIGNPENTYNVINEIIKMPAVPALMILGEDEKTKVPELLSGTSVKIIRIPGDHHYDFNTSLIIRTIKEYHAF